MRGVERSPRSTSSEVISRTHYAVLGPRAFPADDAVAIDPLFEPKREVGEHSSAGGSTTHRVWRSSPAPTRSTTRTATV